MSFSEGCVGGVEPETVTLWRWTRRDGHGWMRHRLDLPGPWESQEFVPLSALRLVEEELRQALEERDGARLAGQEVVAALAERTAQRNKAEADRDRLAGALDAAQSFIETVTQWTGTHPDEREEVLATITAALSPVQGEHHAQPEGESQMDDNNLNHLIGERDAEKWVDGFLTVVPDADRDLMLTWFACAIESGRMTVQGEHEQDGEGWKREQQRIAERQARDAERDKLIGTLRDITRAAESERGNEFASLVGGWASSAVTGLCSVCNQSPCASPRVCCQASTALLDGVVSGCGEIAQDGEDGVSPSLDEVYAERNKVVLAFAALVKEQGWDVGLTVDPSSPDWPVLMIETDAGQVSWHFQAGELPPGLPLFAGKWDGHSTPEKYARLAELVRSAFGLSREIAQDGEEIRRRAIHIIYSGEYDDLTGEQAKALAESDTPLIGYEQDGDTEETT